MTVTIIPITDHEQYSVNGHNMYKDQNNNWMSKTPLSDRELRAFRNYEKLVINNKAFKTHTKATYKG
jgi:hypothetical protein